MKSILLKSLMKKRYLGKYRIFKILLKFGLLDKSVNIEFFEDSITVPADQWHYWKLCTPERYQPIRLSVLSEVINTRLDQFDFIDLGADIGIVSGKIYKFCPRLQQIIAVEPNPSSFWYLKQNLSRMNIDSHALNIAASDFEGRALMICDSTRQSDHSGYIDHDTEGSTIVGKIDDFYVPKSPDLAIKIDVEGQEKAIFGGATNAIGLAGRVVLFLEIHRRVIERTSISAETIFEQAEMIRSFQWFLSDPNRTKIDRDCPFFEQFPTIVQHDVIGVSSN